MKIYKETIESKEMTVIDMQNAEIHYQGDAIENKTDDAIVINGIFISKNNNAKSEDYEIAE